jgi:hypothetical protein
MILYITGVTIRDKIVELIKPPINTNANGDIKGFGLEAIGINPPIAVKEVRITGRKRFHLPALWLCSIPSLVPVTDW